MGGHQLGHQRPRGLGRHILQAPRVFVSAQHIVHRPADHRKPTSGVGVGAPACDGKVGARGGQVDVEIWRNRREGDCVAPLAQRCDDGGRVRRVGPKSLKRHGIRINGKHHLHPRFKGPTCHASQATEHVYYAHAASILHMCPLTLHTSGHRFSGPPRSRASCLRRAALPPLARAPGVAGKAAAARA